jgi:hypothetical protein
MPPRRLAPGLVSTGAVALPLILSGLPGCSGGETAPAVAPTATVSPTSNLTPAKVPNPRPGSQTPGSADYEDKPGGRGRGR